jgi:hypothetical protein
MLESAQRSRVSPKRDEAPESANGLLEDAISISQELRGVVHDQLQLAVLEARNAAHGLVAMMIAGVVVAVLVVSTWLTLMDALSVALVGRGMAPPLAFVLVAGLNLGAAVVAYAILRTNARRVGLPATLRSLLPKSANGTREPL